MLIALETKTRQQVDLSLLSCFLMIHKILMVVNNIDYFSVFYNLRKLHSLLPIPLKGIGFLLLRDGRTDWEVSVANTKEVCTLLLLNPSGGVSDFYFKIHNTKETSR